MAFDANKKGSISLPKDKKKAMNKGETSTIAPDEGTLAKFGVVLGPRASMLGSPSVIEKILGGVIPHVDKEKVDKLTLDQVVMNFFHIIG